MDIIFKIEIEDKIYNIIINSITVDKEVSTILKVNYEDNNTKEKFYYYDEKLTNKFYLLNKEYIDKLVEEKKYTNKKINTLIKKHLEDNYFKQLVIYFFKDFHNG